MIVYVWDVDGLDKTIFPDEVSRLVDGVQIYEFIKLFEFTKSEVDSPSQMLFAPVTDKTGNGITLIVVLILSLHPFKSVPTTLYGVVIIGEDVTTLPVLIFKLPEGDQL